MCYYPTQHAGVSATVFSLSATATVHIIYVFVESQVQEKLRMDKKSKNKEAWKQGKS